MNRRLCAQRFVPRGLGRWAAERFAVGGEGCGNCRHWCVAWRQLARVIRLSFWGMTRHCARAEAGGKRFSTSCSTPATALSERGIASDRRYRRTGVWPRRAIRGEGGGGATASSKKTCPAISSAWGRPLFWINHQSNTALLFLFRSLWSPFPRHRRTSGLPVRRGPQAPPLPTYPPPRPPPTTPQPPHIPRSVAASWASGGPRPTLGLPHHRRGRGMDCGDHFVAATPLFRPASPPQRHARRCTSTAMSKLRDPVPPFVWSDRNFVWSRK